MPMTTEMTPVTVAVVEPSSFLEGGEGGVEFEGGGVEGVGVAPPSLLPLSFFSGSAKVTTRRGAAGLFEVVERRERSAAARRVSWEEEERRRGRRLKREREGVGGGRATADGFSLVSFHRSIGPRLRNLLTESTSSRTRAQGRQRRARWCWRRIAPRGPGRTKLLLAWLGLIGFFRRRTKRK